MIFALLAGSVAVFAQNSANALCLKAKTVSTAYCAHNKDVCTRCPVCEQGQLVYCEDLPEGNQRNCCYRQKPTGAKGGNDRGGKSGESQTVCEKFDYPEIIHRPRCFESNHCKNFPKLRCENLIGNETHGKLAPCCWEGPQPSEIGGRGGKGGNNEGPHLCEGQWANLPKCQGTYPNTTTLDKKCCWPIYYKGEGKGGAKGPEGKGVNATKVTTPVKGTKGNAPIVKPSEPIKKPIVLSKEVK